MSGVSVVVFVLVAQVGLPLYLAWDAWRSRNDMRSAWGLRAVASAAFIAYLFVTGRWDIVGYNLRYLLSGVFLIGAAAGYWRARQLPWFIRRRGVAKALSGNVIALMLFGGLLGSAVRGLWPEGTTVQLELPLQGGTFYVAQGGDSRLINYHNAHPTQRFAIDLVGLNSVVMRAASLYSTDLERYVIFGHPVHSPCEGRIVEAVDGFDDNTPPQTDRANPAGYHVVVACRDVRVFLAHLRRGSVRVARGDAVTSGAVVGRVGNSGNTSEPHLHIHAVAGTEDGAPDAGTPIAILFDDRFAVRNMLLKDSRNESRGW